MNLQILDFNSLTPIEKEHFIDTFERVNKHGPFPPDEPRATIHNVFNVQLGVLTDGSALRGYRGRKEMLSDDQLRGLSNQDLIKATTKIVD